jgi:hypothetical protein
VVDLVQRVKILTLFNVYFTKIHFFLFFQTMASFSEMIHKSKQRDEAKIGIYCHRCYALSTYKEELLCPFKVHKIIIPLKNFKCESRLMQIHNHLVEKPWRILTQYVHVSKHSPYITIHLVSSIHRRIAPNEELCHLTFVHPEEALYDLKGKFFQNIFITLENIYILNLKSYLKIYYFIFRRR